jgi:hypothetical protein
LILDELRFDFIKWLKQRPHSSSGLQILIDPPNLKQIRQSLKIKTQASHMYIHDASQSQHQNQSAVNSAHQDTEMTNETNDGSSSIVMMRDADDMQMQEPERHAKIFRIIDDSESNTNNAIDTNNQIKSLLQQSKQCFDPMTTTATTTASSQQSSTQPSSHSSLQVSSTNSPCVTSRLVTSDDAINHATQMNSTSNLHSYSEDESDHNDDEEAAIESSAFDIDDQASDSETDANFSHDNIKCNKKSNQVKGIKIQQQTSNNSHSTIESLSLAALHTWFNSNQRLLNDKLFIKDLSIHVLLVVQDHIVHISEHQELIIDFQMY